MTVFKFKKCVTEFGKNIFSTNLINNCICKMCDAKLSSDNKFHIQQRIERDKHKNLFVKTDSNKKSITFDS